MVYTASGNTLAATPTGLVVGTQYYWEVSATGAGGMGAWLSIWSFTPAQIPAPAAPSLATATPTNGATGQPLSLNLTWGTVSTAATYGVLVSTSTTFSPTVSSQTGLTGLTSVTASLSGLGYFTTYYWEANATNAGGTSAWSTVQSFTTMPSTPTVPTLATPASGTQNEPTALTLSWTSASFDSVFALQVSTSSGFGTTAISLTGLTGTSKAIIGIATLSNFYWRVEAINSNGVSGWTNAWSFATTSHFAAPINTGNNMIVLVRSAINPTVNGVAIKNGDEIAVFNHSGYCAGTTVWEDTAAADSNAYISVWGQTTVNSQTQPGMAAGEVLQFRVWDQANSNELGATATFVSPSVNHDANDTNVFSTGGNSILASLAAALVPAVPALATPTTGATGVALAPTLSWNSVSTASSYAVQLSTASGFGSTVTAQWGLTGTSASFTGLANLTNYFWRVGAKNVGGTSGWSGAWNFTTIIASPSASPTLVSPGNDTLNAPTSLVLSWSTVTNAASYAVQVSLASGFGSTVTAQWGLTGTSAAISGLANSTTYFWRAGAKDAGGVSGWSAPYSFTTIIAAPGVPILATPTSGSINQPTALALSWTTVTNAATYAVQVSTDAGFGSTVTAQWGLTGSSASISGLANSTTYFWRVGAKDLGGTSGWSASNSFTTIIAAPGMPALVSPGNDSLNAPTSLVLSWTTSANAATYAVQVSLTSGFGSTVTAQIGLTGTSATIVGLANATTYFWRAGAKDLGGVSGWSAPYSFTTIVAVPAPSPVLVSPSNGSANEPIALALSWTTVANAATYAVQVSTDVSFGSTVTAQWGLTGTSATVSGLTNLTTYFWRAGAKDFAGVSGWSSPFSFTTISSLPGSSPALVSPANDSLNAPTSLVLSWSTVTNAATYAVQVSLASGFGSTVTAQWGLTGTSASITGLANATTYFWRAGAKNAGGVSGWSAPYSFTTIIAAPAVPTLVTPANDSLNTPVSLALNWTTVANAASYAVQVSLASGFGSTVTAQWGLTGTSASITGLANATTYFWRAGAKDINGVSGWSAPFSFSTIVAAPGAAPTLVSPANDSLNTPVSLALSWSTVTNAASYAVQVSLTSGFGSTVTAQWGLTGTSASISGLANSTTYFWRAGAKNLGGVSGWSGAWSFTTIIAAPAMPTLATPTSGSINQPISLSLNWGAVTNAASYSLMVSTAANFATTASSQTGLTGTSAALSGLANSATYYWEVNAANIGGTSSWAGAWSFSTIVAAPAVPMLAMPSTGAVNAPTTLALSWGTVANASTYAVQVSTDVSFGSTVTAQIGLTTGSASVSGLVNSVTYFWRVGAKNIGGVSGWSGAWSFTTIIAAPVAPALATPTSGAVNEPISLSLNWGASATATSYSLMVSTAANFATTVSSQAGLTGLTAALSGLANSTTYYWEVNAANIGGISNWSGAWSFTTIIAAPAMPALATPSSGTVNEPTSLALNWGASATATSYSLMVSTAANFATTVSSQTGLTGVTAALSGLANSTTYYWEVNAANVGGMSNWSGAWSFTTIIAAPAMPTLATPSSGTVNASTSPTLAWGAVTNAATYSLMVSTAANFATTVSSQTGLTGVSASLSALANLTTYYWEVNAANIGGMSNWSGAWSFTTIIAAPVAPILAAPTSGAVNQPISLSLNWGAVTGAASYSLMVSTAANFATTVSSQAGLTGVTAPVAGLANGTAYYWEVNAANIGGMSMWSAVWNFTTIVAAPAMPSLASPASGAIDEPVSLSLNWGTVPGATSYALMVSTAANFATTIASQTGLTNGTATVSGLASGGTYYWVVNAANIGGMSAWSGAWSFTTLVNFSLVAQPGWNMISFNIRPADSNAVKVFGDSTAIANNHNFILVKNLAGYIYCPTLGISDSIVIQTGIGLQMYSSTADTVRTAGSAIAAFSTPIPLFKGWNLAGYLPPTTEPITTALTSISSQLMLVKDNDGDIYWPEYGIDVIDTLAVGQGYFIYMTNPASLTYSGVAKRTVNAGSLLRLPKTAHYAKHANTGNNASVLATLVSFGSKVAPDSCEIGAFDGSGTLVGSGTVIHGLAAFSVWGKDLQTKSKDGLSASEKITFKMWNKTKEYPVEFKSANGNAVSYAPQAVFLGSLAVPEAALITEFNLAKVYPNPFHGFVQVAFDVPTINGVIAHNVEINVFNMKGSLVHQLARGKYNAGHYVVSWSGESVGGAVAGSGIYVIQMKADNFDKRLKLVKVQ